MGRRAVQVVLFLVTGIALFFLMIELLARRNNRIERRKRAVQGDRLYARVVGDGKTPIVFIAGLQATSSYWEGRFDPLAERHRVIYLDLLGFGDSPWPDVEYTLDDQLAAIEKTLAALNASDEITLVGHSFGTIVAAHYAAAHPGQVRQLVLLGAPVFANEQEARKRIWDMSTLAALFSLRPLIAREACLVMGAFRPQLQWLLPKITDDYPDAVIADSVEHFWPSVSGSLDILLQRPISVPIEAVGSETTFIHGRSDTVTPISRIHELAASHGATVVEVAGGHHTYVNGASAEVIRVIRDHRPANPRFDGTDETRPVQQRSSMSGALSSYGSPHESIARRF